VGDSVLGVPLVPTRRTCPSRAVDESLRRRLRGGSLVAAAVGTMGAARSTCVLSVL